MEVPETERRPISQAELQLLADAWRIESPELRWCTPGEVLASWRKIADRHRLFVEYRKVTKDKQR